MNKLKAVTLPLALSSVMLTSCVTEPCNKYCNDEVNIEQYENDTISVPNTKGVNNVINYSQAHIANIPKIDNNFIQYKDIEGKIKKIGIIDQATVSLYKAVQKYSNNCNSDITDIGGFYASVESNIPKNEVGTDAYNIRHTNDVEDINRNMKILVASQRHTQCSQLFNNLFNIFTSPKSEKGDTITVNEYTKMMDAWSSTGY